MCCGPSICQLETDKSDETSESELLSIRTSSGHPRTHSIRRRLKHMFSSKRMLRQNQDGKSKVAGREADSIVITSSVMTPPTGGIYTPSITYSALTPSSHASGVREMLGWKTPRTLMEKLKDSTRFWRHTRRDSGISLSSTSSVDLNGHRIMSRIRAMPVDLDQESITTSTSVDGECHCFPPMIDISGSNPRSLVASNMRCMVPRQQASSPCRQVRHGQTYHHELDGKPSPCYNTNPLPLPTLLDDYLDLLAVSGPYTEALQQPNHHRRAETPLVRGAGTTPYGPDDIARAVEIGSGKGKDDLRPRWDDTSCELDGSDTMLAVRRQEFRQRPVRDSIAGRFELHGFDVRVRDGMVQDTRAPRPPGTPRLDSSANFCDARAPQNTAGPPLSFSSSPGSNNLQKTASSASCYESMRSHFSPSSSASSRASDIAAPPQIKAHPRPKLTICTRHSAFYGDLPNQLARAFSALHGADSEKRTAIRLELELLLVGFGHIGLHHRDPVLEHDLRRILGSLEVASKAKPYSASSDDSLRWDLTMAQDAEPATRDGRQCTVKPPPVAMNYTRKGQPALSDSVCRVQSPATSEESHKYGGFKPGPEG